MKTKPEIVVTIKESYKLKKNEIEKEIRWADLCKKDPTSILMYRSLFDLELEWATHKALYNLGIKRARTKDVDLDAPQPWYMTTAYIIIGLLVWPFIR